MELYSCASQKSFNLPSLQIKRSRHAAISVKSTDGSLQKCYVFSEDSIEFLNVNLNWNFVASAQKTWTLINLAIPKIMTEPSLLPLSDQIVIGGGEMMPGMLNFMIFGVSIDK